MLFDHISSFEFSSILTENLCSRTLFYPACKEFLHNDAIPLHSVTKPVSTAIPSDIWMPFDTLHRKSWEKKWQLLWKIYFLTLFTPSKFRLLYYPNLIISENSNNDNHFRSLQNLYPSHVNEFTQEEQVTSNLCLYNSPADPPSQLNK